MGTCLGCLRHSKEARVVASGKGVGETRGVTQGLAAVVCLRLVHMNSKSWQTLFIRAFCFCLFQSRHTTFQRPTVCRQQSGFRFYSRFNRKPLEASEQRGMLILPFLRAGSPAGWRRDKSRNSFKSFRPGMMVAWTWKGCIWDAFGFAVNEEHGVWAKEGQKQWCTDLYRGLSVLWLSTAA